MHFVSSADTCATYCLSNLELCTAYIFIQSNSSCYVSTGTTFERLSKTTPDQITVGFDSSRAKILVTTGEDKHFTISTKYLVHSGWCDKDAFLFNTHDFQDHAVFVPSYISKPLRRNFICIGLGYILGCLHSKRSPCTP